MKSLEEIQKHLDENVNTLLGQHRGRVDITKLEELQPGSHAAFMKMSGGCQGCAGAKATMRSIVLSQIQQFEPLVTQIVDVTDHQDKTNAFFKE